MNKRLIIGSLLASLSFGCSGGGSTGGSGGRTAGTGGSGSGTGGSAAGTGGAAAGTGGTGGSAAGTGGAAAGTGGAAVGTGGSAVGTGGAAGGAGRAGTGGTAGGAGRAGTGGTAGGAGRAGTGGAGGAAPATGSVLERNNHPSRDGHFIQPTLTKAAAARMARDTTFTGTFTGNMWASPLFLEGPGGTAGVFIAVTTGNNVIALDETTGEVRWMRNIGTPSTSTSSAGGQCFSPINPLGILSTPVIDGQSRTIYVAGATGSASGITAHIATAINADDGTVRAGWPVDVSTALAFDPKVHNQRSALSLVNGILYVAYGGFVGDCGSYRGRIVAINTATPTMIAGWATGGVGEGIWAAAGMASDGNGVIAITGNNTAGVSTHADSEQVVRVTGMGTLTRNNNNVFFPSSWRTMDSSDADFGSCSPVILNVPGATPSSMVLAIAKDGHMYLLNTTNFGGSTPVVDFTVATGAMAVKTAPTAYSVGGVTRVALTTDSGAQCPSGGGSRVVMGVSIPAGAPPVPTRVWCATLGGSGSPPSPISTSTDGSAEAIVWIMNNGNLNGIDGETGAVIFNGGTGGTCSGVRMWTSPIAVKGRIVVGGDGHLCSWSPH